MNIFVSDACPVRAAWNLDRLRLRKMILESAQLLSTLARGFNYSSEMLYKPTYTKHPCTLWLQKSWGNYKWLWEHAFAMEEIYRRAAGRDHASRVVLVEAYRLLKEGDFPAPPLLPFQNCARNTEKGVDFSGEPDTVLAYRKYLNARWDGDAKPPQWYGNKPEWRISNAG